MNSPFHGPRPLATEKSESRFVSQLTKNCFAMILAGGRGSRLKQLTDQRSKPAVPFAGKFRIIDFALSNCVNSDIRKIGVATQYKAQSLIHHLQRGWSFLDGRFGEFVQLLPAQQQLDETLWYRGTADAVYQNLYFLKHYEPEHILLLSGDHIYKMDYGQMLAAHAVREADMTVACLDVPLADAREFGVMATDADNRVVDFIEKPQSPPAMPGRPDRALASMGIYVFNAELLYDLLTEDSADPNSSHDFGKDIIPKLVRTHKVFSHCFADSCVGMTTGTPYWRDVGTLDAYWEANMELTKVTPELNLYDKDWPIWTYQPQLPPAKFVFDDDGRRGMAIDSMVSGGCIISGASVRRSLLFSNVRVNSFARVEDSVILPHVEIGAGAILRRAIVDKRCRIPDGLIVGMNPEEDRRRFEVTAKGITLITPEMLGQ